MSRPVSSPEAQQEPKHLSISLPDIEEYEVKYGDHLTFARNHFIAAIGHNIRVYSLPDFRLVHSLTSLTGSPIRLLDAYLDTLVTVSRDNTVEIWDLITGKCLRLLDERARAVDQSAISLSIVRPEPVEVRNNDRTTVEIWPKEPLIVMGTLDSANITIWRLLHARAKDSSVMGISKSRPFERNILAHNHRIQCLAAKGKTAVTGCSACTVRVWDITTGACQWVFMGHKQRVTSVDLDHKYAYSGSMDATMRVWNLQTGECPYIFSSLPSPVAEISVARSGLVSYGTDRTLTLWDHTLTRQIYQVTDVRPKAFHQDDFRLFFGSHGRVKILDTRSSGTLKDLLPHPGGHIRQTLFRGRFCVALVYRDNKDWLEIWEFPEEEEWEKVELDEEDESE